MIPYLRKKMKEYFRIKAIVLINSIRKTRKEVGLVEGPWF